MLCSDAGCGLYGVNSLVSAGKKGGRVKWVLWKNSTLVLTFLVTSALGMAASSRREQSSRTPGMSCMSFSACCSMSAICLCASCWPSGESDFMYSRMSMVPVTPTLRRISGKSIQGTVSVPSCEKVGGCASVRFLREGD